MARPRKSETVSSQKREADLRKRAATRNFTLQKEGEVWYARIGETRFGPLRTLADVEEFLPKEG